MVSLHIVSALTAQSNISQPIVILAVSLGFAGVAILILFSKGKI